MDHIMFSKVSVPIARWINQLWCINLGDEHICMNVISMCVCIFVHPYCFCESMFPKWKNSWKQSTVCKAVGTIRTVGAGRSIVLSDLGTYINTRCKNCSIFGSVLKVSKNGNYFMKTSFGPKQQHNYGSP